MEASPLAQVDGCMITMSGPRINNSNMVSRHTAWSAASAAGPAGPRWWKTSSDGVRPREHRTVASNGQLILCGVSQITAPQRPNLSWCIGGVARQHPSPLDGPVGLLLEHLLQDLAMVLGGWQPWWQCHCRQSRPTKRAKANGQPLLAPSPTIHWRIRSQPLPNEQPGEFGQWRPRHWPKWMGA